MLKRDGIWHEATWDEALDAAADGLARNRGPLRRARLGQGHQRGRLRHPEARARGPGHQQRGPLHAALPLARRWRRCWSRWAPAPRRTRTRTTRRRAASWWSARTPRPITRSSPCASARPCARGARLIVVNPKRVELCDQADLWIQERPGTDVALFNAMAKVILDEGLARLDWIAARTEGFEAWAASLEPLHARARRGASPACRPRPSPRPPAGTRGRRSPAPASSGAWASPSTSTAPPTPTRC